jgi:hypothetical protein
LPNDTVVEAGPHERWGPDARCSVRYNGPPEIVEIELAAKQR